MPSKRALHIMIVIIFAFVAATMQAQQTNAGEPATAVGQQVQTPQRLQYPPLFFREDWALASGLPNANTPQEPEHGVVQTDLTNPNLEVHLWGDKVGPVTVNLTGLATIRWRTKVTGFHLLHPIIKLADGTWLVGDHAAGFSTDWVESQIQVADVRWRKLDIQDVVEGRGDPWVEKPDLSRVEEIGFTEMMRGGGHGGAGSRIDWIEVYGKPVPRAPSTTSRNR